MIDYVLNSDQFQIVLKTGRRFSWLLLDSLINGDTVLQGTARMDGFLIGKRTPGTCNCQCRTEECSRAVVRVMTLSLEEEYTHRY